MLSSLLFMTSGEGYNDSVAWKYLEEIRTGLIALDAAGDDAEKLDNAEFKVASGMIGYMERRNQLLHHPKKVDYRDYERWEEGGKKLVKEYLQFRRKYQPKEHLKDDMAAGLFVLQMREIFRDYLMDENEWEEYGSIPEGKPKATSSGATAETL